MNPAQDIYGINISDYISTLPSIVKCTTWSATIWPWPLTTIEITEPISTIASYTWISRLERTASKSLSEDPCTSLTSLTHSSALFWHERIQKTKDLCNLSEENTWRSPLTRLHWNWSRRKESKERWTVDPFITPY